MKKQIAILCALISAMTMAGCGSTPVAETGTKNPDANETSIEELGDRIPMVMVEGELYQDTGKESEITGRCGVMDGEISSAVDSSEIPTKNDQSNFGTDYGYQRGLEDTIEVYINDKWIVFEKQKP